MSALGQFYDAILAVSEDQGKKYGQGAKPDFVAGAISDSIAEGLTSLGVLAGSNPTLLNAPIAEASRYADSKFTIGKLNLNQLLPVNVNTLFPGDSYSTGSQKQSPLEGTIVGSSSLAASGELKVEFSNVNDILLNPNEVVSSAVDNYVEGLKKVRNAKFWGGLVQSGQEAAQYKMITEAGIDNDVAATLVNSRFGTPGTGATKVTNPLSGSVNIPDMTVYTETPTLRMDHNEAAKRIEGVLDNSLAMYAGITDKSHRDATVKFLNSEVKKEVVDRYYGYLPSGTPREYDFYGLFSRDQYGKVILTSDKNTLFNTTYATPYDPYNHANNLQMAMMDVLSKKILDPAVDPNVKKGLQTLYDKVSKDDDAYKLFNTLGLAYAGGSISDAKLKRPLDVLSVAQLGTSGLVDAYKKEGNLGKAGLLQGVANNIELKSGELTPLERLQNVAMRYSTFPKLDQLLTPAMLFTGDGAGYANLINALGGLTGSGPISAYTPGGLSLLNVFGKDNVNRMALDPDEGKSEWGIIKAAYGTQVDKVVKNTKIPIYKRDSKGMIMYDEAGRPIREVDMDYKLAGPSWGKVSFTVGENANTLQKYAYAAYVFHPVNIVKGVFNGTLFHHAAWMASGHGALYSDKKFANFFSGKVYGDWMSDTKKYSKQIDSLASKLRAQYNATGDKNALRASRVLRWTKAMNNPNYKQFVATFERIHKIIGLPGQLQKKALELAKRAAWKAAEWAAIKLGLKATLESVLALATSGASLVITRGYAILNFITFGLLDKVVFGTLKVALQTTVGVILGIITLIIVGIYIGGLGTGTIVTYASMIGGGAMWPPSTYEPQLGTTSEPPPEGIGPGFGDIDLVGADGIDVSHWQGTITWPKVRAAGVEFAIIKASEGTGFVDSRFKYNWQEAKKAGIPRSAYHFFRPELDGRAQADHYLRVIASAGGGEDFVLSVDVEQPCTMKDGKCVPYPVNKFQSTVNLKRMVDRLEERTGRKPMIYTSYYMWRHMTTEPNWGGDEFPLWVAAYNNVGPGQLPKGWTDWTVWQYSSNGKIDGINGNVDLDKWGDSGAGLGGYLPPDGPIGGINPNIDWSKYADLSSNHCPVQSTGGTSITRCTQGPFGPTSHRGVVHAVDIGTRMVPTAQVVAPVAGRVVNRPYRCINGGVEPGIKLIANDGREYLFIHVFIKPGIDGKQVAAGTVLGAVSRNITPCSSGPHVHFEYWLSSSVRDKGPDAAYATMCGLTKEQFKCDE